jgi:hypothetical protein
MANPRCVGFRQNGHRDIGVSLTDKQSEPEEVHDVKMIVRAKRRKNPIFQRPLLFPEAKKNRLVIIRKVNNGAFILVDNPVPPRPKLSFPTHCQVRQCSTE